MLLNIFEIKEKAVGRPTRLVKYHQNLSTLNVDADDSNLGVLPMLTLWGILPTRLHWRNIGLPGSLVIN